MNNQIIGQQHTNTIYKLKAVVDNLRNVIEKDIERQLSYSNNMNLEDSFYDIQKFISGQIYLTYQKIYITY